MSIVQHIKVLDSQLANIKIVAGSTIYTRDTGKHFIDISDTERVQISDIVYIDTDKERTALLAPLPDKLYITRDTNKVWIYSVKSDKWVCLNIDTTYTAGTGININGTTINNSGVRSVTAGASADKININTNGNTNTITINNVANATSAGKATNDSAGQQINTTYIKGLSVSGKVITYTKGDGTTGTITTQDTNTWRGIQNVLTSDSTSESLSAAQGKALKGLVDGKADKATTLSGYGITDANISDGVITLGSNSITPLTSHQSLAAYAKTADVNNALSKKADKATTLSGYGITDAKISDGVITLGANSITPLTNHQSLAAYAKTADVNTALDKKANKATTLSGYGITDAKISNGTITLGSNTITPLTNHQSLDNYYTKGSVDNLISNLKAGLVNVVESLPTAGENGKLYLVKTGSESENLYTEYVYVNKAWEKLGTQKLDLSGYLTKTDAANTYLGKTTAAASANKLNTNAGSATQPIYFANGVPVATTYTLGKSVPSDAKFTDTVYNHPATHPASMITGLATVATSGSYNDLSDKPAAYSLPDATASVKGGVKIGSNLTISSGTLSLTKANVTNALGYTPPTKDTTYNDMTAATASAAGTHGLVPAPAAGKQLSFLRGDGTWVVPTNTTYPMVSSEVNGIMAASDKVKLDGIAENANNYSHPSSHPASMITGLATVATSGSYNDLTNKPAAYSLPDATASVKGGVKVGSNITVSSGTISLTKANVTSALGYTPPTTDTNTHYTTGLIVGKAATDTANAAATNGNVFLNLKDDSTIRNSHKIVGSGATTVTSDASGNITISSTNTVYTHPSSGVTAGTYRSVTVNAQGHVTGGSNPTTLAGYGITDAKISNGTITLGGNSITPLTVHQSLDAYVTKAIADATYLGKTATAASASKLALDQGTADAARPVIFQDSGLSTSVLTACYNNNLTYNPVSNNLVVGKINGFTIGKSVPANAVFTDTVYTHPTTHPASMITGLATVATSGSYNDLTNKPTIPAAYSLPDATASVKGGVKIGSNISVSSGTISLTKANVTNALGYTPPTTNTDTHWTTGLKVGASATATVNAAATNGNVFLNVLDNTTVRDSHNIVGSGATTVTSDANGKITISSTNTVYTHPTTHPASMITGLATVATSGSYNDLTNKPTIPAAYSLPDATASVKGGVKIGSNLTVSSGTISLTKANVVAALGYTPPTQDTNTTYSASNGISLSGTTFSNSGVRSIATGSANGTISVNTNGTSADVAVKGLGSAAYTASSAYAAASHSHNYLPLSGGTMTGTIKTPENSAPAINFRAASSGYTATLNYDTSGNEALAVNLKNSVTSFMVNTGVDGDTWTAAGKWTAVTPALQVKQNSVYINELIPHNVTPAYKLNVNGNANIKGNCSITGQVTKPNSSTSWVTGRDVAPFRTVAASSPEDSQYVPILSAKSYQGSWDLGPYTSNTLHLSYIKDDNYSNGTNAQTADFQFKTDGTIVANTFVGSLSGNASTATKATQDSAGQQINTTYIKGLSVSGTTITYTKGDGTTGTIKTQDTNTVYTHPTTHPASMITGLATVATSGSYNDLSNKPTSLPANGGNASTATKATQDSDGNQINTTYVKKGTTTNLISHSNEFNFVTKDAVNYNNGAGVIYINWRFSDGSTTNTNLIKEYRFANGTGDNLAIVSANKFKTSTGIEIY